MFEIALVAVVIGDGPTAALIGDRIFPLQGPPDLPTDPYITYQNIAGSSDYTFEGAECRKPRVQFDIWSPSSLTNRQILICLRNLFSGFAGTLNDGTRVLFTDRLNEIDDFQNDSRVYRSIAEYQFEISEP